jgi:LEA14-like dessication related protein
MYIYYIRLSVISNLQGGIVKKSYVISIILVFVIFGCNELKKLQNMANVKNPDVKFESVKLTALSFEKADLMFNLKVINPNDFNITLSGFDYDLLINENSFLKGRQNKGVAIKANNSSMVQIPLSLRYTDLFDTYSSLKDADVLKYTIKTGLLFNVPILGNVRVPVSKSGELPALKIPSVSFRSIKLNNIGFSGADLEVKVAVDNSNTINISLKKLDYSLNVNGEQWADGRVNKEISISEKKESILTIPIKLDFMQMGSSIYKLLKGNSDLNIEFKGNADMISSHELLKQFDITFDETKKVKLAK